MMEQDDTVTLDTALRQEYRNPGAYIDQAANLVRGIIRLIGWWSATTVILTTGVAIVAFMFLDLSLYSVTELRHWLKLTVICVGTIAALACVLGKVGAFRNKFSDRASARVQRFESLKREVESQVATTVRLLAAHQLITAGDVDRRRSEANAQPVRTEDESETRRRV